eukprot:COSAG02_NODE_22418_length_753_cov_1.139144_1_plen_250_part_11
MKTADGRVILEPYDPLPSGWATQTSRSTGRTYYVNHSTGQSTFDRNDPMIPKVAAPAPAPIRTAVTPTRPMQAGQNVESGPQYTVKLMARVRSGFEQSSADQGVAKVGEVITELESRVNEKGIKRIRFSRGWISAKTADGRDILTLNEAPLPQGWTTQKSRSTGRTYFVNHTTGQSTFDRNDPMITKDIAVSAPLPEQSAGEWGSRLSASSSPISTAYMSSTQQQEGHHHRFLPLSAGDVHRTQHHATEE